MRRLVAMVGDAHATLGDPHGRYATRVYPISVLLPADGAYITASTPQDSHLLFVLIGAGTCSSGLRAARDFNNRTNAILVGSPTGGKPNSFGEQQSAALPYSGLVLHYWTTR